jgi:hypothetical protein
MKKKYSDWQRILRVMEFYRKRGICKESVVDVYRKINLIRLAK